MTRHSSLDELVDVGSEATRIPVGGGFAGIIGDGSVNDEGWIEVFQSGQDRLAVVHGSGQPYDHALKDALAYPTDADAHGGSTLTLPGGELALLSLQVRWRTRVAEDAFFARWLLSP